MELGLLGVAEEVVRPGHGLVGVAQEERGLLALDAVLRGVLAHACGDRVRRSRRHVRGDRGSRDRVEIPGRFQRQPGVSQRDLASAREAADPGELPVADGSLLGRVVRALHPMPQRGVCGEEHLLVLQRRPVRLLHEVPRAVEAVGREVLVRRRLVKRALHLDHLLHTEDGRATVGEPV